MDNSNIAEFEILSLWGGVMIYAKVALARKIAALSLSMLKNNEVYYDDWEERLRKRAETRKLLNK